MGEANLFRFSEQNFELISIFELLSMAPLTQELVYIQFCPRLFVDAIVPPLINLQNYEPTPRHLPPPIPVSTASGLEDFSDVKPGIMELIQEEQRVSAQLPFRHFRSKLCERLFMTRFMRRVTLTSGRIEAMGIPALQ